MTSNDHFRTGPAKPSAPLKAALDPLSGFRLGTSNPLANWTGGAAPVTKSEIDPRLVQVIRENVAEGLGAIALAADAALGRKVSLEEIKAASVRIPMGEFKANFKLTASIGRQ